MHLSVLGNMSLLLPIYAFGSGHKQKELIG